MESDPGPLLLQLSIAFFLVLLNGFFVATEFSLMNAREHRVNALALQGKYKAKIASKIFGNLKVYISACRMGITMASLGLGWLAGPAIVSIIQPLLHDVIPSVNVISFLGFFISFTLVAAFHYMFSQQLPKIIAIQKSEQVALWLAAPLSLIYKLLSPFMWLLDQATNWILKKTGMTAANNKVTHTEEEIKLLVKESYNHGHIDHTAFALFDNVFEFTETIGREIMIPRTEIACLYANKSFAENLEIAATEMRTRYPVCDPDKDHIIGFVHIKDLLKSAATERNNIRTMTRPLLSVPETTSISDMLIQMQKKRTEIALLIDEYGGTSGIVTMEDILEELVGEIYDEFDKERPAILKKDMTTHSVDGLLNIDEFNDYFGLDIKTDDYDTIGGWTYSQLDTLPRKNQRFLYEGYEIIVDEVDHHRISRIIVKELIKRPESLSVAY